MAEYYNKKVKEVLEEFDVDSDLGLSDIEVNRRQKKYGKNTLEIKTSSFWQKIIEPFRDLFMIILLVALLLSILQGSLAEIIVISLDIFCDAAIFYVQQFSTERILRNLKQQTIQKIHVLRNGKDIELEAADLVPGDIVFLNEGDRVPADGRIISESGILTNESMLTGEADSIAKDAKSISGVKKIYEQRNMVFSGSFIITGTGKMVVVATGNSTEYGHIATLASGTNISSPIQDKINKLVVRIAIVVLSVAAIVLIIQLLDGISFFESAEFTLAMIVSAIPEDLPIATAIILAIGATRMAKKKALIKELRSIQSIGIVTTVASDKTGTLTENRLSLQKTWAKSANNHLGDAIVCSALPASESGDPMDTCIWNYATKEKILVGNNPLHSYAFDQSIRMSGNLYKEKSRYIIYLKGAPEVVLKKCSFTEKENAEIVTKLEELASFGYKILAIATVSIDREINELSRLGKDDKFTFLGLAAISDTIRREARTAISEAARAGVKVKMVTGDHAGTAFAIGRQLGLAKKPEEVLDCSKLSTLNDEILAEKVKSSTIFARVTPEDKYRILESMKKSEIVAMTGDGVNDVPALMNAHVGIAMGDGPSIVQDAGDIVLVDNNFKNIVEAIKEGRIILTNIRRMLIYLLATNAGEVLTMIIALVFGHTQLLLPIQILWVNLVTDSLMIIPIGLEPAEKHFISTKPEQKDAPILPRIYIERMLIISITMALITFGVYQISSLSLSHAESNTLAFISLVVMQWANAFNSRGIYESAFKRLRVKNPLFLIALLAAISLQLLATFGPLMSFVSAVSVPVEHLIYTVLVAFLVPILTVEIHKLCCKKYNKK